MNRSNYFNYIERNLNTLSYRIKIRGKINLLDLNIYSESFFAELMNYLLHCNLKNINHIKQNTEGIDLIDTKNKIIVQVSSTCTKQKIENSLSKEIFKEYSGFHFKFIAIVGEADKLKSKTYENPHKAKFIPSDDIYDIKSLLNLILDMSVREQHELYEFFKEELGESVDLAKVNTNLASIINILSKENLGEIIDSPEINAFEILKKIEFNDLSIIQPVIEEYKVYYSRLNEKYKEFDKQGANKSLSVLGIIRNQYVRLSSKIEDSHELFFAIIDKVMEIIKNSKNYVEIPDEELEMCVSIIVVDAFIRCKIFKNPEGYHYVVT